MTLFSLVDPRFMLSGFFAGPLVGQTGMGGGALMTPILVLFFGVNPATAVGTDLLYASVTKLAGTLVHGLNRTGDWRIVTCLASGSVPATLIALPAISHFGLGGPARARIISMVPGVTLLLTAMSLIFRRQFLTVAGPMLDKLTPLQAARYTIVTGAALRVLVTISSVGAGTLGVTRGHAWLRSAWPRDRSPAARTTSRGKRCRPNHSPPAIPRARGPPSRRSPR
ncbi:MAG: sulfite exporter TauE/SafE family protein [Acetobacteraceae bacterium]|nr:sulfite exporter TauE/SafE family protein [Acetobacteraceae bacterium]